MPIKGYIYISDILYISTLASWKNGKMEKWKNTVANHVSSICFYIKFEK